MLPTAYDPPGPTRTPLYSLPGTYNQFEMLYSNHIRKVATTEGIWNHSRTRASWINCMTDLFLESITMN